VLLLVLLLSACAREPSSDARVENVLLITVDTLRADRVGAYGYARASTPALDALAKQGARFDRAWAPAPITQTSHASLLTGRNPAGHGARHNGMRLDEGVPTIAGRFKASGRATAAFVAAFPLDKRFGLARGFDVYDDRMPIGSNGRTANERPGRVVVDAAIAWLNAHASRRFFVWVHLFEPHAPYGDPSDRTLAAMPSSDRYDRDVSEADAQIGRLLNALANRRDSTLIVAAADHGEAFGEHEEIGHSIFTYDTTLRVPLIIAGPGIPAGAVAGEDAGLIDVAPTVLRMAGIEGFDADGTDLRPRLERTEGDASRRVERQYYAESFAPLLDFGWSPLRAIRSGEWKYIEAPRPELYNLRSDPGELTNRAAAESARAAQMADYLRRAGGSAVDGNASRVPAEADSRLAALGYVGSSAGAGTTTQRADPKDKIRVAAAIARITSGEARGPQLEGALRAVLAEDPPNPQMNLRYGFLLAETGRCRDARGRFDAAIRANIPTADAHLGLAGCQASARDFNGALQTLRAGARVEPGNPVVMANIGLMYSEVGRPADAIDPLKQALAAAPDLHQARFGLALALARLNRREEAAAVARDLLQRLPSGAPQRGEVQRLLAALTAR